LVPDGWFPGWVFVSKNACALGAGASSAICLAWGWLLALKISDPDFLVAPEKNRPIHPPNSMLE